jgi:hypothetical protein
MQTITDRERDFAISIFRSITAWIIDVGRAIKNGGGEQRIEALDHCQEIIDDIVKFNAEEPT